MNISFFYAMEMTAAVLNEQLEEDIKDTGGYLRDIFSGEYRYNLSLKSAEKAVLKISVE